MLSEKLFDGLESRIFEQITIPAPEDEEGDLAIQDIVVEGGTIDTGGSAYASVVFNKQIQSGSLTTENLKIVEVLEGENNTPELVPVESKIEIIYDPENDKVARGALIEPARRLKFDTSYNFV